MAKSPVKPASAEISYDLYIELLDELLNPIEPSLDLNVRYELYLSKLVYLENLLEQCFRSVNGQASSAKGSFSQTDLHTIQDAITSTHGFMRDTILEALELRLSRIGFQRQSL